MRQQHKGSYAAAKFVRDLTKRAGNDVLTKRAAKQLAK